MASRDVQLLSVSDCKRFQAQLHDSDDLGSIVSQSLMNAETAGVDPKDAMTLLVGIVRCDELMPLPRRQPQLEISQSLAEEARSVRDT